MSESGEKRRSFFGGAAMRDHGASDSAQSLDNRSASMRGVALAGKSADEAAARDADEAGPSGARYGEEPAGKRHEPQAEAEPPVPGQQKQDPREVSPASTPLEEEEQQQQQQRRRLGVDFEGDDIRDGRRISIEPPKPIEDPLTRTSSSPTRDSRFREEMG